MKYYIHTLGCQMNYSDSERIASVLDKTGYLQTINPADCDIYIFNTCSIRKKAEDKVHGKLKHLGMRKKVKPNFKVGLTGCMVEKTSHQKSKGKDGLLKKNPVIDFVFRIEEMQEVPKMFDEMKIPKSTEMDMSADIGNYFEINPKYSSNFQAFVPIATGCDNFCSYCVVPHARGREISRTIDEIVNEVQGLAANGCRELTLLGQNVDSYGLARIDKKNGHFAHLSRPPFVELIEQINKIEGIERIYFTSSHPKDMSDELIEALGRLQKMSPYVHLPVQSGDNTVLRKMNRFYSTAQFIEIWRKLKKAIGPRLAFSTDIIVGFCGETEEQFMNTYKLFEEVEFDMAFIAQFSMRKNTLAARGMVDDISYEEKSRRFHMLNALLRKTSLKRNQAYLNKTERVLVYRINKHGLLEGRTDTFKRVDFEGPGNLIGQFVDVKITDTLEWLLKGELLEKQIA